MKANEPVEGDTRLYDAIVAKLGYDPLADNDETPSADGAGGQLAPDTAPWQSGASPNTDTQDEEEQQ